MKNTMKCVRFAALLLAVVIVTTSAVGCQRVIEQDPVYSEYYEYIPIEPETESSDESISSEEDTSGDVSLGGGYDDNDNYNGGIVSNGGNKVENSDSYGKLEGGVMVYSIEEFGAVGDGKTDDGVAINDAVQSAQQYTAKNEGKKAVVRFAKGKTYVAKKQNFAGSSSGSSIMLKGASNLTIEGNNSTIIGTPEKNYILVTSCSNVKIKDLNFTFDTPVAYRAKVTAKNNNKVTFQVPQWYTKCIDTYETPSSWFAIPANNKRDHSWITAIEKVDATHCTITFSSAYNIMDVGSFVDLPTPGYSHNGLAFGVRGNSGNVELENLNVWNASQFVFQVNNNSGNIKFTNVNLAPKNSSACPTVAWRDCIHAKDNRGSLTFNKCNFSGTHDDLFNISNTMLGVTAVDNKTTLDLYGYDYNGSFVAIKKGDTVVAFNPTTDKYYGVAKVAEVVRQHGTNITIKLDKDIGIEKGAYLAINELAAPGTTINGGNFSGTVRIRASGTKITNANFNLVHMWTAYEGNDGSIEGPIPENITYKNCSFKSAFGGSNTLMTFNCKLIDGNTAKSYAVKNIVFDGCDFEYDNIIDRSKSGVIIK